MKLCCSLLHRPVKRLLLLLLLPHRDGREPNAVAGTISTLAAMQFATTWLLLVSCQARCRDKGSFELSCLAAAFAAAGWAQAVAL